MIFALITTDPRGRTFSRTLFTGTRDDCLDEAERRHLCARAFHPDGTELAPRMERGFAITIVPGHQRARRAA